MDAARSDRPVSGELSDGGRPTALMQGLTWDLRSYLNGPVLVGRSFAGGTIAGLRILITGASSGIGRAVALRLAAEGAMIVAVARRERELALLYKEIVGAGGDGACHTCDLSCRGEVDGLVRWLLDEYGGVDIVINNAGRSMRRPIVEASNRLDDFDRAMAVNYIGPVRLTMGLLPAMLERRRGHVINVGTWTIPVGTSPRFAAYHSSKAALAGFGRCLGAELAGRGVRVTAVHYPLVHTAMSAPTARYARLPGLTADEAAGWIVSAIRRRPAQIVPRYVLLLRAAGCVAPGAVDRLLLRMG
jgi:NAD(P)-dependent dehydrogenase (short-subunit alcohol dehydrogenase family)